MTEENQVAAERLYKIGTASSLTGVDPHTIRAWERRYGAIKPMRNATGRRQYDDACIERLQLLKALVDCSEAIGTVAHLSDDELRKRLARIVEHEAAALPSSDVDERGQPLARITMLAPATGQQIESNAGALSGFEIIAAHETADSLLDAPRQASCEIVLLELDRLGEDFVRIVESSANLPGQPQVVVLYRFASASTLAKMGRAGASVYRGPINLDSLRRLLEDQMMIRRARGRRAPGRRPAPAAPRESAALPDRRFDDAQLARLLEMSTAIDCECPNHLSSLVSGLVAFEQYSRQCESRDDEDAAMHRRLAEGTARSRAMMEDLLAELCRHEGIDV